MNDLLTGLRSIFDIFINFFKALRDFLLGIKLDKIESLSKFADGLGNLGNLIPDGE